jgi:2-oxoglutarate ferredoxin oxidoreductase subunit alpha
VSAFQVHIGNHEIHTPGDEFQVLVALNPAALKAHLADLEPGGLLIVNSDAYLQEEWEKAGYASNPLNDETLRTWRVIAAPMNQLNQDALARINLSAREAERCKSFLVLGMVLRLFDRPLEPSLHWIRETYVKNPAMIEGPTRTFKAGYQYAESVGTQIRVGQAALPAGRYRRITGIDALALGMLAAARRAELPLVFACSPQPAVAELLHRLCAWKQPNTKIVQAEDDPSAINLALGTSFGGALGVTATSGPGLALQSEGLGLAVMSELPCVVIDIQRAGPSTGMPTKPEQTDLLQALHGRNGESPLIVLAPATPGDAFDVMIEAVRLAVRYMAPVVVLADSYLAQSAETWSVPSLENLIPLDVARSNVFGAPAALPYERNQRLARPWAIPGTPAHEYRTGGLEKDDRTGNVSYDPLNHQGMVKLRARKIAGIAHELPPLEITGPAMGDLLVLGWGSTFGAIRAAAERCRRKGLSVASAHLRYLHPMPKNVGDVLKGYRKVLVPEMNAGQLCSILRSAYLVDAVTLSKVQGLPFLVTEIESAIIEILK